MKKQAWILPIIVLSQFLCTTLWFAGNAVMPDLMKSCGLEDADIGYIISSVQFGFIVGTLSYSFWTISDRYNPSLVFFISALLGSVFNMLIVIDGISFSMLLGFRFFTGFFLAGIYPVGMKIASDYFARGLGKALSLLVGALVLGTAFPHLINEFLSSFSWKSVFYATSFLTLVGGSLIFLFVKPGPYRRPGKKGDFRSIFKAFKNSNFKAATLSYFGHMWELYTFWAFVPMMLLSYATAQQIEFNVSIWAFLIIAIGSLACIIGGLLSIRFGEKRVIVIALISSGLCCLLFPFMFHAPIYLFLGFLIFWGCTVIVDSPLLSALVAYHVNPEIRGTALTITNSIGFTITILSIQLVSILLKYVPFEYVWIILALGPALGLYALSREDKAADKK
ncbi:MFS transporter [Ekhidna sp.]